MPDAQVLDVASGESNVNQSRPVPTICPTVIHAHAEYTSTLGTSAHTDAVVDVQLTLAQLASANSAVGERSEPPKFSPVTVIDPA